MSAFADASDIPPQQIWSGVLGRSVHGENVTLALVELEAGAVVPEHSHVNEQLGLLVEGSVRFRVGDEERELQPGSTWRILADLPHSVAVGPEGAVIVEVFAPARADWGALEQQPPRAPRWPAS